MKPMKIYQCLSGLALLTMVGNVQAGIEYSLRKTDSVSDSYTVYARSSRATTGVQAMVSGAQVSLVLPVNAEVHADENAVVEDVHSGEFGLWQVNSWNGSNAAGHAGQSDQPGYRVMSVGQVAAGARIEFAQAGDELALFNFVLNGCQAGDVLRLANNQNDPEGLADAITAVPNSIGSNASNSWTSILGEQYGNNYPSEAGAVACK